MGGIDIGLQSYRFSLKSQTRSWFIFFSSHAIALFLMKW